MSDRLPMTRAGYDKLEEELRRLKAVERPKIVKEIELARAHGDISENAEFHAAKERQSHLEGRVRLLEDKLARAVVIDPSGQSTDAVRFGVTVHLEDTETGDRVVIDFTGKIDGVPFEGGTGGDVGVSIGSGTFIPGFEDQLIGAAVGEQRTVNVTFPQIYPAESLAGKNAEFDVTIKSVEAPKPVTIDDEFAKSLGLESLAKLKDMLRERLQREHALVSRQKLKRKLLDELDARHKFAPPPSLVEDEFTNVWKTIVDDLQAQKRTFADEGTTEDKAREEYRGIAERRVRLGLVIAEIGERNQIKVSDEELSRAVMDRARQMPGSEQKVLDFYRSNPNALASLRAPIFEDKVVDFLIELAEVTPKTVTREELYKEDEA
jgi:trigger factor